MKILKSNQFVSERMKIVPTTNNDMDKIKIYHPETKNELIETIEKFIKTYGNECNLNIIDTSDITNMSWLFEGMDDFNGDISKWDVSKVTNMTCMFAHTRFSGDLSNWNVSKVTDMREMFTDSDFNGNISNWNVSSVKDMSGMFRYATKFKGDISNWNVGRVEDMSYMFEGASSFNSDISKWSIDNVTDMSYMFAGASSFDRDLSKWSINENTVKTHKMFFDCPLENHPEKQPKFNK